MGEPVASGKFELDKGENTTVDTRFEMADAKLWSAERPNRYTLVAELKDQKGRTVDVISTYFGVRQVPRYGGQGR